MLDRDYVWAVTLDPAPLPACSFKDCPNTATHQLVMVGTPINESYTQHRQPGPYVCHDHASLTGIGWTRPPAKPD
jgi:hypothetical protein